MGDTPRDAGEVADSVRAVADVLGHLAVTAEQMHQAIARRGLGRRLLPPPVRTAQDVLTAFVYGAVRAGVAVAGAIAAVALDSVERTRTARPWTGTPRGRRLAGMLNGAFGDRLADHYPALAAQMRIRAGGADVDLDPASLALHYPAAAPSVVVFVHGVIETDEWWTPPARTHDTDRTPQDFGARLTRDLGCSCVQVRYNSGKHISDNGADLNELLDALVASWPVPLVRLALVGHSMGGLVARSAVHQAAQQGRTWPLRLRHVVCLGTPHTGAPLERGANTLAWLLRGFDESAPVAGLLATRSAGIKDLRHGCLDERDWLGEDPDAVRRHTAPHPYRPPGGVGHSNLAATLSRDPAGPLGRWAGDLIVRPDSALAPTPPARSHVIGGLWHADLLTHDAVYMQLRDWLRD